MVAAAIVAAHWHYTTVAATHPTSHDALNRDLTRTIEAQSRFRDSGKHPFGSTGVNHDRCSGASGRELSFERRDNVVAFLASERARNITGEILEIAAGAHMRT